MAFGFLGCNPEQTWDKASDAPALGTTSVAGDNTYVLVQADGDVSAGAFCIVTKHFEVDEATTTLADDSYPCCIPQVAIDDDEFGWGLIEGTGMVEVNTNCAADVSLATTGTAGRIDDADTAGRLSGIMLTTARGGSAGLAPMSCFRPRLDILA